MSLERDSVLAELKQITVPAGQPILSLPEWCVP